MISPDSGVTEFGPDADSCRCSLHPAIEDVTDAELAADFTHVDIAAAKAKAGPSRYDEQLLEPGKAADDVVNNAVREIGLVGIGKFYSERQNGNRMGAAL